jgi:peptidylprolyl isomerase domain and WD repeat-containing protein 1
MATSENPALLKIEEKDPTLVCTAFKQNRFYVLTKREPDSYAFIL